MPRFVKYTRRKNGKKLYAGVGTDSSEKAVKILKNTALVSYNGDTDIYGDVLLDESLNDNDAILYTGRAHQFDGVTDFATVPSTGLTEIETFTVAAWVYPTTVATSDIVLARNDPEAAKQVFNLGTNSATVAKMSMTLSETGIATTTITSTPDVFVVNTWVHVAATFNAGTVTFYANGSLIASTGGPGPSSLFSTDVSFSIGSQLTSGAVRNAFPGYISDVRFYSSVLSAGDVFRIYETGADPSPDTLEGRWMLSESSHSDLTAMPVLDRSGNDRHGVYTGCNGVGSLTTIPQTALESWSRRMWFDGVNDYVTTATSYDFSTSYTISGKCWLAADGAAARIFNANVSNTSGIIVLAAASNLLRAVHHYPSTNTTYEFDVSLTDQSWNSFSITFDSVAGTLDATVNGSAATQITSVTTPGSGSSVAQIGGGANNWKGIIYDLTINGDNYPGTGNQVSDWQTGATVTGSPTQFLVPTVGGVDVFGDTPTSVRKDGALNLFGEAGYAQLAVASPQSAFTFAAWVKFDQLHSGRVIDGRDGAGDGSQMSLISGGTWRFQIDAVQSNGSATPDVFTHVVGVYTGSQAYLYLDGALASGPNAVAMTGTTQVLTVGKRSYGNAEYYEGQISHPIIYNRALSAQEIVQIYTVQRKKF